MANYCPVMRHEYRLLPHVMTILSRVKRCRVFQNLEK